LSDDDEELYRLRGALFVVNRFWGELEPRPWGLAADDIGSLLSLVLKLESKVIGGILLQGLLIGIVAGNRTAGISVAFPSSFSLPQPDSLVNDML